MNPMRKFLRSLRHAWRGLVDVAKYEQSFRLQIIATTVAVFLAWFFPLNTWERILVVILCSAVLVLEILNSIIERFADAIQPRLSSMVGEVKDMMAGAVFVAAITAAGIGIVIFYPHFYNLIRAILTVSGGS